jgi:predicted nucleotidyltransferase
MNSISIEPLIYDQAWLIAEKASKVLQEKYHVKEVFVFGSLLDINNFRSCSDIDLAVTGLPENQYYLALNDLLDLTSDFSFDLVQIESIPLNFKHKILNNGKNLTKIEPLKPSKYINNYHQNMKKYLVLVGQINEELKELNILIKSNERIIAKINITQDEDYFGTVALNLHSFYCGVERIFKQIAQIIDNSVPDQADWHRQLLRQMMISIPDIRPQVISSQTKAVLDEYCSFRHVVRNIYSINLKGERVQELAKDLNQCYQLLEEDLRKFIAIINEYN